MIGPWRMVAPGPMAVDQSLAVEIRQVRIGVDAMVAPGDAVSGTIAVGAASDNLVLIPTVTNKTPFVRVISQDLIPATPTLAPAYAPNREQGND